MWNENVNLGNLWGLNSFKITGNTTRHYWCIAIRVALQKEDVHQAEHLTGRQRF